MKLHGNLFREIVADDNILNAHKHAKKGKGWYSEVRVVEQDIVNGGHMLDDLKQSLIQHTFHTSAYKMTQRKEGNKIRDLYKLPYYPDRIAQWAVIQVIEPYIIHHLISDTFSAIPNRGIHLGLGRVQKAMWTDVPGCQYCLKMDAKHFYQSINHEILKDKFRRLFKDPDLLWFIDEVIDSISTATPDDVERLNHLEGLDEEVLTRYIRGRNETPEERKARYEQSGIGLPIGNYFSQYGGNFYFSEFDHFMKEVLRIRYYFRYMDDIVIFARTKAELHRLCRIIDHYFQTHMRITLKGNYQIFPTYERGVDYLGYRTFLDYTLLRKSTCLTYKRTMTRMKRKVDAGKELSLTNFCAFHSYEGWLEACDSFRLYQKYGKPLETAVNAYYAKNILPKKKGMVKDDQSRNRPGDGSPGKAACG